MNEGDLGRLADPGSIPGTSTTGQREDDRRAREAIAQGDLDAVQRYLDDKAMEPAIRHVADSLIQMVRQHQDPGFHLFVSITDKFLEHCPPDLFTGESGDIGPEFVVGLRRARERLRERMAKR